MSKNLKNLKNQNSNRNHQESKQVFSVNINVLTYFWNK